MNAFAVPGTPNLSTCAQDGYHEGFNLGIRYYPASSPQRRWAPMEVLPTLKKEQKKKRDAIVKGNKITCTHFEQSYTHTADNLVDSPTIHTVQ